MKYPVKYVLGLDIGIGSVGWAVIRCDGEARIEDFGVRIFDSGENSHKKSRKSQERRGFRSARRLIRRRAHRKERIRFWFQKQGLASEKEIREFFAGTEKNIIVLRVRALDEKITPAELAACMIHISNHRGYRDFYDPAPDGVEDKELLRDMQGVEEMRRMLKEGGYRSVAEMFARNEEFGVPGSAFRRYRNRQNVEKRYIMPREELEKEAELILKSQQKYYSAITDEFVAKILDILFSQRDFEDGPGDPSDEHRPYQGFAGTEGNCRFYPDEKRGCRFTRLADLYALVNVLSQYRYFDEKTGELHFSSGLAEELLSFAEEAGGLSQKDVQAIAKKHGIKVFTKSGKKAEPITQAVKYLKAVKPLFEGAGFDWKALLAEDACDMENCLLNRVGTVLSRCITPRRRREQLKKIERLAGCAQSFGLIEKLTRLRISGTANVSYKYMEGAISAFRAGEIYGNFQAEFRKEELETLYKNRRYKLAAFGKEFEFYKNPVVMRSICETRKAINRVIEEYGSPYAINLEVGSELNRSFEERQKIDAEQSGNEARRRADKKEIAELLGIAESEVTAGMCERYALGKEQNWQCLYSGRAIDKAAAVRNADRQFEVDHIVPFSLVLDNTLQNKALVFHEENQKKGQRVPLEYLNGEAEKELKKRVNALFRSRKISEKKYNYLFAKSASDTELMESWKSRNLNDMRYISRFLVQYLDRNLQFRPSETGDASRPKVYAVKGAITSRMRRLWLNRDTWGRQDKAALKQITYLDHAADAIVVACCLPAYVEMTAVHQRLRRMLKANGGVPNGEYEKVLAAAKENIGKFYRIPESRVEYLLTRQNACPALIRDLRREVDIRLQDPDIIGYFKAERAWLEKSGNRTGREEPIEAKSESLIAAESKFRQETLAFYRNDPDFAKSLKMPFTVHVPSRKASGKVTDANAVRIVEQDGKKFSLSRKAVSELTGEDLKNLYTRDEDLRRSLAETFEGRKGTEKLGNILAERGEKEFVTRQGTPVRRVTLRGGKEHSERMLRKQISENNYSLLPDSSYYCVEIYRNHRGKTCVAGIAYSDIVVQAGKVRLKEDYCHPEGYGEHCMYLFRNDYIRISSGGTVKFEGYYRSVGNINRKKFSYERYNTPFRKGKEFGIAERDTVEKIEVDPIGRLGGIIRCGEPLSSVKGNE